MDLNPIVRAHVFQSLKCASDEHLLMLLLQLVQLLKYEPPEIFLPDRTTLAAFLIERSCQSLVFAFNLFFMLKFHCESEESDMKMLYESIYDAFLVKVFETCRQDLSRMLDLATMLNKLCDYCQGASATNTNKNDNLQTFESLNWKVRDGVEYVHYPINPSIKIVGFNPSTVRIAHCSLRVDCIPFHPHPHNLPIFIRTGRNFRIDQLIVQLMKIMNRILLMNNIDLHLIDYSVLPLNNQSAMIEFVEDSISVHIAMQKFGSIKNYLKAQNKTEEQFQKYGNHSLYLICLPIITMCN